MQQPALVRARLDLVLFARELVDDRQDFSGLIFRQLGWNCTNVLVLSRQRCDAACFQCQLEFAEIGLGRESRDLLRRGFKFVGSTICYALMQATGMVNDHLVTCPRHPELDGKPRRKGRNARR